MTLVAKAIFLSYASQDEPTVQNLARELRDAGLEVWFDRGELRGGDAWDASIRQQIKTCTLLIPVISANTQARSEGYFRREWKLAVDRMSDMAEDHPFLLPVVIDDTPEGAARVPDAFRERQWLRLKDGAPSAEFIERVRRLLDPPATPSAIAAPAQGHGRSQRSPRFGDWRWAIAGVVAICLAGIASWSLPQFWKTAPAPAPPAMSVAILPFAAPHDDADASRFADALARYLVTRVGLVEGRTGRVQVVSGLSVTTGGSGARGAREMGRSLNVRYLLEGDVLRGVNGNAVNLRLVDTAKGGLVWSERRTLQDSDVATESSASLYGLSDRLRSAIVSAEIRRVEALPAPMLSARELVLRANAMLGRNLSLAEAIQARKFVDEALRLEPDLEPALIAGALITNYEYEIDPHPDHDRIVRDMDEFTRRAIYLEPSDPGAWHMRTYALAYLGRWEAALQANDMRIKLAPGDPNSYTARAEVMNLMGRPDEALKLVERALALNPGNAGYALWNACQAHLLAGQAEQAIATCERATGFRNDWQIHVFLAAAYANNGDTGKAAAATAEVLRTAPRFTIAQLRAKRDSNHPEYVKLAEKYWYSGLRKAGFPEK